MDADENSSTKSKDSSTSILRSVSIRRPRRGTLSGGDGTSSTTKQKIATAINQIVHRRASVSTPSRPKDLAAISVPRPEPLPRNTPISPITDKGISQQLQIPNLLQQQQQQVQQQDLEQRQFNIIKNKSPRPLSSHSTHNVSVSPTQSSFPLSVTTEEDSVIKSVDVLSDSTSNSDKPPSQKKMNSSLFTRDNKNVPKDDRMEKLLKKAKNFLDHKQRSKARVTSLWNFIDVANELDQAQFFQQHAEDVFDVIYKSFMGQVDKIKQKSERPMSFSSKEFLNVNKTLLLLRKVFLFLPDRIRSGWQRGKIAEMLKHLLDHGNHHRVRIQGFQLLLLWINDQTIELTECVNLYANAISLDLFLYDQIRIGGDDYQVKESMWRRINRPISLGQISIKADDRGPLFPNPHPPTFHDIIQLIQMDLSSLVRLAHVAAGSTPSPENYEFPVNENIEPDNGIAIGMGIDAAFAAAKFHFELTKKQYLVKLFPQCAKNLYLIPENQEIGFQKCPPSILRAFITFLIHHCLDNNETISDAMSSHPSPATPILKSIVLGAENREFAHEIVRQALMLPAGSPLYKDIVRGAVHIVGIWILSGEEERPVFLRKSPSTPQPPHSAYPSFSSSIFASSSYTSLPSPEYQSEPSFSPATTPSTVSFNATYANANVYLRRYIVLLTLVFEDHSLLINDGGIVNIEVEAQVSIYRDVLALYRSIMAECPIELEPATWETLLSSLLDIQERIMNQSNKYALISSVTLADDLADYLVETVLYAFARSKVQQPELWRSLANRMSISLRWSQTVSQWAKIMLRMTKRDISIDDVLQKIAPDTCLYANVNENRKSGRRPMSIHQDIGSFESKSQTLLNIGTTVFSGGSSIHSGSIASDDEDQGDDDDYFDASSEVAADDAAEVKSNRTSSSSVFFAQPNFSGDKLSVSLANFRCPDFIRIEALSWSTENALLVWKNLLCALGNLNYIQISPNHAEAIKCIVDIVDMLSLVRNNQYGNFSSPFLFDFAPWLFEACNLPLAFAPGRALAYAGLCKIMSCPHEDFDEEYYPHFYRALLKGLSDQDSSITLAIINNSTKLFSQNLPGCNILYYSFIETIRNLLSKHDSNTLEFTIHNSITILCSLICIVNQLPSLKVPNIPYKNLTQMNEEDFNELKFSKLDSIKYSELRLMLQETLLSALSNEDTISNYETHNMLLYGLCTLAFDELTATPWPDKTIIKNCLQALLEQLYWSHLPVVTVAADCLITIAQNSSLWSENENDGIFFMIIQDVFGHLIGSLNEHLALQKASHKNGRGFIIAKIFYCLLDWLMVIPPNLFTDTELCQLVFDAIEMAFELSNLELNKNPRKKYPMTFYKNKGKHLNNEFPVKFKKAERKVSLDNALEHDHSINVGFDNSAEDVNFVKEIAEFVLLHLTHHLDNFSPIHGPAMMHSTFVGPMGADTKDDETSNNYHYFSFNDTTIITLVEIPGKDSSASRMIIRDFTGKYSWDSKLFYENKHSIESNLIKSNDMICENMMFRPGIKVESNSSLDSFKDENGSPKNRQSDQVNMLDNLLQHIGEKTSSATLNQTYPLSSTSGDLLLLEKELDRHTREEIHYDKATNIQAQSCLSRNPLYSRSTSHSSLGADFSLSKSFLPVLSPVAEKPSEAYQQCRLFLSHFGWLTPESLNDGTICVLNKGSTLFRDIRLLDKKHAREVFKFALLYVGPGQEDEQSILHNTSGSEKYNEFVQSLGWEIDLTTHPGYLGGLERNCSNGLTAVYYCTSTIEIIFHDVTKMPTDPNDPKQLRKKRHIGNDHVHIVWNENNREYRKSTIGGDFGNVQIVISPLPNELYSVDIYRDSKIPPFGPLLHGMVISRNVLGPLVRMTAIQAFRNSLHNINSINSTIYQHSYVERAADIQMIMSKYKNNNCSSFEAFMSKIFFSEELVV
ncbi:ral GTPase-activating protein subunit alpha-2-like [Rhizophagus clarus]|uniref:Ral GTPase-activating protein subunit alpha-2-like n=1 Tax=Rhizophagus clarus TaxID=94130 RepID=A0A8H3M8X7_9GLOM|nr:ral GTPase-activating protein subunit alpha-2-like [Rhizophagus clarus]